MKGRPHLIALEIALIFLLIIANGAFALSELALVSARRARLKHLADRGDPRAQAALTLKENPDQLLATAQIGITLIGILTGAFGGATLSKPLADYLQRFPGVDSYAETLAFVVVVFSITYFSLVMGELVPKRIALNDPERFAIAVARPMRWLSRVSSPFVRLLAWSTDITTRLLGMRPSSEPPVTEEEVRVLLQEGTAAGVFEPNEKEMVEAVFRLGDRRVGALVTPRRELVWLDVKSTPEQIREVIESDSVSRVLLCEGDPDHVVGLVHTRQLLLQCVNGDPMNLREAASPALFVPESTPAVKLLGQFRKTGEQLAVVVDEHGGTQGIVTLTDLAEAVLGALPERQHVSQPEVPPRDDGSWLIDGRTPMDEVEDVLGIKDEDAGYDTLGGFVLSRLGHIPQVGEAFEHDGCRFEVVDMDGLRVDRVLVACLEPAQDQAR
jgi:putative hemolysin